MVKFDASMILLAGQQVKGLNILYRKMLAGQKCAKLSLIYAREIQMCRVHWREKCWHENVPCASLAVKSSTREVHTFFPLLENVQHTRLSCSQAERRQPLKYQALFHTFGRVVSTAVGHRSKSRNQAML